MTAGLRLRSAEPRKRLSEPSSRRRADRDWVRAWRACSASLSDQKEQAMSRFGWTAACALAGVVLSSSCELRPTGPSTQELAELRVSALVAGTPIDLLVVRVTALDIPTPLVFNLPVQNGVAQGTIRLPPGIKRTITVDAYDTDGDITAEGIKTIDVKPGQNPPVSIPLVSKAGQVTITVTIGPVSVVVQPTAPTVQVG